ncbi:MAG: hypothetical protein [Microviridae sp.]|nr:MAG: hypothetical protein [Microviridae sp.]
MCIMRICIDVLSRVFVCTVIMRLCFLFRFWYCVVAGVVSVFLECVMAVDKSTKVTLSFNGDELELLHQALILSRASALRLSNRLGASPDVIRAYRAEYERVGAVLMVVSNAKRGV